MWNRPLREAPRNSLSSRLNVTCHKKVSRLYLRCSASGFGPILSKQRNDVPDMCRYGRLFPVADTSSKRPCPDYRRDCRRTLGGIVCSSLKVCDSHRPLVLKIPTDRYISYTAVEELFSLPEDPAQVLYLSLHSGMSSTVCCRPPITLLLAAQNACLMRAPAPRRRP